MKITRRELAQAALAGAASAQQPPQSQPDELELARKQVELFSEILRKYEIPVSAEPAFQFKA